MGVVAGVIAGVIVGVIVGVVAGVVAGVVVGVVVSGLPKSNTYPETPTSSLASISAPSLESLLDAVLRHDALALLLHKNVRRKAPPGPRH